MLYFKPRPLLAAPDDAPVMRRLQFCYNAPAGLSHLRANPRTPRPMQRRQRFNSLINMDLMPEHAHHFTVVQFCNAAGFFVQRKEPHEKGAGDRIADPFSGHLKLTEIRRRRRPASSSR
jgi:hypothetical protein